MWRDVDGNMPPPITIITSAEVRDSVWRPFHPGLTKRMVDYTEALEPHEEIINGVVVEVGGRYPLCIWPPHCLIGSPGAAIVPEVSDALNEWSVAKGTTVDFVAKGTNPYTEHYSAVKAEVPDPKDPSTKLNTGLIQTLEEADMIILTGEAGSHCLANTVMDIADGFSDQSFIKKLVLITDGTSPVPGFENLQEDFINKMTAKGMQLSTAKEILS
jgi:nicotinamidase-related amidase